MNASLRRLAPPLLALLLGLAGGCGWKLDPGPALEGYGYDVSRSPKLPGSLRESLDALEADTTFGEVLGMPFVNMFVAYKRNEIERFDHWITDWEFREYTYHI